MKRYFVLRIDSFEGDDTFLRCGNESQDFLYAVVLLTEKGQLEIVDSAYRSVDEAIEAWPEANQTALTTE